MINSVSRTTNHIFSEAVISERQCYKKKENHPAV